MSYHEERAVPAPAAAKAAQLVETATMLVAADQITTEEAVSVTGWGRGHVRNLLNTLVELDLAGRTRHGQEYVYTPTGAGMQVASADAEQALGILAYGAVSHPLVDVALDAEVDGDVRGARVAVVEALLMEGYAYTTATGRASAIMALVSVVEQVTGGEIPVDELDNARRRVAERAVALRNEARREVLESISRTCPEHHMVLTTAGACPTGCHAE